MELSKAVFFKVITSVVTSDIFQFKAHHLALKSKVFDGTTSVIELSQTRILFFHSLPLEDNQSAAFLQYGFLVKY